MRLRYGYVAASRFRKASLLYHYGRIRRTDWLPVAIQEDQQAERGPESVSVPYDEELDNLSDHSESGLDLFGAIVSGGVEGEQDEDLLEGGSVLGEEGEEVDEDSSFMDIGMESIEVTKLAQGIQKLTGRELGEAAIFENDSARALASHLSALAV